MTNPEPSPRQTLSYLRSLFRERGIRPKNKLGQNFLIDLNLLDLLVRSAELTKEDLVIEVGSGTGGLTGRLAEAAGAVLSVEIDPDFADLVEELMEEQDHVVLFHADILRNKNELNPEAIQALADLQERTGLSRLKLVANLPYSVATPVITNFLLSALDFDRMVVTVQWEIGERLIAHPGRKEFGALAVLVQSIADVELIRQLPPSAFWPQPKVSSAIVRITPNAEKREQVGDPLRFRHFLRDLYVHKRKNLRGALHSMPLVDLSKEEIDDQLEELGLEGTIRAEALTLEQHLRLSEAFG